MVVAQGLAVATTEAALYLYQSAQSLWRAWQASAHLMLEPQHTPMLHPTSLPTGPAAASTATSLQQNRLTDWVPVNPATASASLQQSPTQWAPSQLQKGQVDIHPATKMSSVERAQPLMGILSGTCRQVLGHAGHRVCGLLERVEAMVAVISHTANPAEGITLLLPLGVLVVGGLAAAWARCGMALPQLWEVRMPLLVSVTGEHGKTSIMLQSF